MKRKYNVIIEIDEERADIENIIRNKFKFEFGCRIVDVKNVCKTRTTAQNSALHLWFSQIAEELNSKHFDMRAIIRQDIEIEWTGYTIKEYLFKPLLRAKFGKKTTTKITTNEINDIFDIINKTIAERTGGEVEVPNFPSIDNLREVDYY